VTLLDDERSLRAADGSGMLEAIAGLPRHCREGHALGLEAVDLPSAAGVAHAGSGLGAFSTCTRHIRQFAAIDSFLW